MTTDEVRQALDRLTERCSQNPSEVFTELGQASFNWFMQALQLRRGAELLEPEIVNGWGGVIQVAMALRCPVLAC
jgi:hypothetical protein